MTGFFSCRFLLPRCFFSVFFSQMSVVSRCVARAVDNSIPSVMRSKADPCLKKAEKFTIKTQSEQNYHKSERVPL